MVQVDPPIVPVAEAALELSYPLFDVFNSPDHDPRQSHSTACFDAYITEIFHLDPPSSRFTPPIHITLYSFSSHLYIHTHIYPTTFLLFFFYLLLIYSSSIKIYFHHISRLFFCNLFSSTRGFGPKNSYSSFPSRHISDHLFFIN